MFSTESLLMKKNDFDTTVLAAYAMCTLFVAFEIGNGNKGTGVMLGLLLLLVSTFVKALSHELSSQKQATLSSDVKKSNEILGKLGVANFVVFVLLLASMTSTSIGASTGSALPIIIVFLLSCAIGGALLKTSIGCFRQ